MSANRKYEEVVLLRQIATGDEVAFRALYDQYRNKIYSLGMYLTRSPYLSEEIVQDVFMKVWEKREDLESIEYFNAWLRTVARNICLNHLRSIAIQHLGLEALAGRRDGAAPMTEYDVLNREYEKLLQEAIELLPPQRQRVYQLSRQLGMQQDEIARELGISVFTVKEHRKLALRSIKSYLEKRIDISLIIAFALFFD